MFESKAIFKVIVIGTAKNIPTIPNTYPQRINEKKITRGESPNSFPISFGSIILLIEILMIIYKVMIINVVFISTFNSEIRTAGIAAIIER